MSKARDLADFQGSASALTTGTLPVDRVPYVGRRNLIINGGFDVWQRGTSFSGPSPFSADRWKLNNYDSGTFTGSKSSTTLPNGQIVNTMLINQSVAGAYGSSQGIFTANEDPQKLSGQTVTVSFWANFNNVPSPQIRIQTNGTGGTTVSNVFTPQSGWSYYTATLTVPTVASDATYHRLMFDFAPNNTVWTAELTNVQLELGSVATPFEHRSYGEELALCQRYYETCGVGDAGNYEHQRIASNSAYSYTHPPVRYKVTKRVAPSVTIYGLNGTAGTVNLNGANSSYTAVYQNGTDQFSIYKSIPSGYLNYFFEFDWTADAEL